MEVAEYRLFSTRCERLCCVIQIILLNFSSAEYPILTKHERRVSLKGIKGTLPFAVLHLHLKSQLTI